MQTSKKPMPIATIYGIRNRIDTNPDFQRPAVWSVSQKQLLVDTILRDYDVPKLYWRKTSTKPDKYDVVDGQQRLRAIWDFYSGAFKLPEKADSVDDESIAGCSYQELPDNLRMRLDVYALDIVILEDTDEDEVREMFLRLQNGTSLKAQEKRNAYQGEMRNFICELAKHQFFTRVQFANSRFAHDHVAAQMVFLEIQGGHTNVKNADLNKMYITHRSFDTKGAVAKATRRALDILSKVFVERTPELERYNVIALYCVVSEVIKQYDIAEVEPILYKWFVQFETERRSHDLNTEDDGDPEWITYREKISHSTDAADSIRWRMEFMLKHLLQAYPNLSRKDNQRSFTHVQKLAVFRRDAGHCLLKLKCDGARVTWDDWHCDHKVAWTNGGATTVENGQVACSACNLYKGSD